MNHIVAKEYLCFDALLEMIISDSVSKCYFSQTDLAEVFGITIPVGTQIAIKNVKYSSDTVNYGTNVCAGEINNFLHKKSIPLKLSYIPSSYFDEMTFIDMIVEKSKNSYVVFAFCYGVLYSEPQNNDVGHVVLLEKIDTKMDTLQIYDPGPRNHGSKMVKVDDMIYAMKKRGGIYLFEKVDH